MTTIGNDVLLLVSHQ